MKSQSTKTIPPAKISEPATPAFQPKQIFIVEDHPVFRGGLAQIVNSETDLKVCGMAGSAERAFPAIARLHPDLVLVDITLPGKNGIELIRRIRKTDRKVKFLVISMHEEALYADRVLRAGGDGYIMKEEDPGEIIDAMRDVLAGRMYLSEAVLASRSKAPAQSQTGNGARPLNELTDKELEILELLGRQLSKQEIAGKLGLSLKALSGHCKKMQRKLNLRTPDALVRAAVSWSKSSGS